MYYLEKHQFKPAMILLGILFIPSIMGLIVANIILYKSELLIILLIVLLIYLLIVLTLWKLSNRKKYYLLLKDNGLEISFYDLISGKAKVELSFEQIVKVEYYRISSIKGWLMLFSYILPKCVYITYIFNGEEHTKLIGYLDIKDVKEIAKIANVELKIY